MTADHTNQTKRLSVKYPFSFSSACVKTNKNLIQTICTLFLLNFIYACSSLPQHSVKEFNKLQQVSEWQVRGKVLLRNEKEKVSGYFFWHQNRKDYTLSVNSFIGTNVFSLKYEKGLATLQVDGKTYKNANPEQLVYQVTGQVLPVNNLANWMLGNVNTARPAFSQVKQNEKQQLSEFHYQASSFQPKWHVKYNQYQISQGLNVPSSMTVNAVGNKIKLTINDWEFIR